MWEFSLSAEGGNRTRTLLRAGDFESPASTYFTTSALDKNLEHCSIMSTILDGKNIEYFQGGYYEL